MRWTTRCGWRKHAYRATAMVTAATMLFACTGARAAEPVLSNLDLLTKMTSEVAEELYGKFGPQLGGRTVALRPFANGEDYVFVGNVFTNVLTGHGVNTIAPGTPSAPAMPAAGTSGTGGLPQGGGAAAALDSLATSTASPINQNPSSTLTNSGNVVLTFQNVSFGLSYPDVYRSHMVGGKKVERRADVRVHAVVTESGSERVLWVGEAFREYSDEFDMDESPRVEQGNYQFARPVMPGGGFGKYAEPVFVTGIIVGLIYLFFSNQSDN